jgi:hypothetical protein
MEHLIKNIFDKLTEPAYKMETDEVGKATRDAASRGLLFSGMYFEQIYKAREKALQKVALAVIDAYKQAQMEPGDSVVENAKKDVEDVVDGGLERLKNLMRQSYAQAASISRLEGNLVSKLEPARRSILKSTLREIEIWAGLHNKSKGGPRIMTDDVFVIMRIGETDTDQFYEQVILPAAKACSLNAFPVNLTEGEKPITTRILDHIKTSRLVICDLTYERPNCYFEAGYALGMGVDCVFTARWDHDPRLERRHPDQQKVHFDLDSMKITYWKIEEFNECKAELEKRIRLILGRQKEKIVIHQDNSRKRFEAEGADL